jgi:hypothetical protein
MGENKQRELIDDILDNMSDLEFAERFCGFFGLKRALILVGWAVLFGVAGIENGPSYRAMLEEKGLSRSTAFRASADMKRFRDHLEAEYHMPVPFDRIVRKLGRVSL